eukprot:Nk52_evm42s24 gene=Nk52_evmTU42s24
MQGGNNNNNAPQGHYDSSVRTYNIFVGDLARDATNEDLKVAFEELCGEVAHARVFVDRETGMSKGYGFVHFVHKESQEKALADDLLVTILDRQCRIGRVDEKKILYIGNLPNMFTAEQITDELYGLFDASTVVSFDLKDGPPGSGKNRGFGFLELEDNFSAERCRKALIGKGCGGRMLNVSWADKAKDSNNSANNNSSYGGNFNNNNNMMGGFNNNNNMMGGFNNNNNNDMGAPYMRTCYVAHLSMDVDEDQLRNHMCSAGPITKVLLMRDNYTKMSKGYGFVEYETRDLALSAQQMFDGTVLGEQSIQVTMAKPPNQNRGGMGGYNNNFRGGNNFRHNNNYNNSHRYNNNNYNNNNHRYNNNNSSYNNFGGNNNNNNGGGYNRYNNNNRFNNNNNNGGFNQYNNNNNGGYHSQLMGYTHHNNNDNNGMQNPADDYNIGNGGMYNDNGNNGGGNNGRNGRRNRYNPY